MGWETRDRGGRYYTRSRKVNGRVVREYVGGGLTGELAASQDARRREERAAAAAALRALEAQHAPLDDHTEELWEMTGLVIRGALVLAGYHQHHRGEWRKRRGVCGTGSAEDGTEQAGAGAHLGADREG